MTAQNLPYALYGILTMAVLVGWFYSGWQSYVIERTRHRLYQLRDGWFDTVAESAEWRDHPASRLVRRVLNAEIRWTHQFCVSIMVLRLFSPNSERRVGYDAVLQAVARLPTDYLQKKARQLVNRAALEIAWGAALRSWLCGVVVLLALPVVPLYLLSRMVRAFCRKDSEAAVQVIAKLPDEASITGRVARSIAEIALSIAMTEDATLTHGLHVG
jgi:hypothetical protein